MPPREEYDSSSGGFCPYGGVFEYRAAPIDSAPAAFACPKSVLLFVAYSSIETLMVPDGWNATYFNRIGSGPLTFPIANWTCIGALVEFAIEKTSTGSAPAFCVKPPVAFMKLPAMSNTAKFKFVWAPTPFTDLNGSDHWNEKLVVPGGSVMVWKRSPPPKLCARKVGERAAGTL